MLVSAILEEVLKLERVRGVMIFYHGLQGSFFFFLGGGGGGGGLPKHETENLTIVIATHLHKL